MTLVSKKQQRAERRRHERRMAYEHTIAWGFCLTIVVGTLGMIFWPLWLLFIAIAVHIGGELSKCRAGAYDESGH